MLFLLSGPRGKRKTLYIKTEQGAQAGLGHVARDGWILSLGTPPQPQGGKRQVSLNTRGERRPNRDNRHHPTKVIKVKANQPVFTSQHHNFHARAPVPFTRFGLPTDLGPWDSCHPPTLRGRLPPASYKRRPGCRAFVGRGGC